jgi:mevalonate kinase
MISSSAPGKIILFGEHAVVYGRPALAVPVTQVQATATVAEVAHPGVWIEAPDIGLHSELSRLAPDHPLAAVTRSVFSTLGIDSPPPLTIHITSTIPVAAGLGSGAAVSVAIIRALSEFLGQALANEHISALAYEVEKLYHGTPSGIDNTVITYAKPVYFIKGQPIEVLRVARPFVILIGDSGLPAPTKESVGDVRKLWEADKHTLEGLFDEIGKLADRARTSIENGKWEMLGPLMNENHALLQQLTVSSPRLDQLVEAARGSGALGAKLSGGGRGGNMIALIQKEDAPTVAEALRSAGARRVIVTWVG